MNKKRVTIYHIAEDLGLSASYVSRALNNHPSVSQKIREKVKNKAAALNYKHNSHAANLRQGSSKTIGVVVPRINESFFSDVIAGIEEVCFKNNHGLIICQSHESFQQECKAVNTLIHQDVDCILISISAETQSTSHLESVRENNIELIQFDRYIDSLDCFKVLNDNKNVSYDVANSLINEGYKKIAFLGGPDQTMIFRDRKEGYLKAIADAGLSIPSNYIIDTAFSTEMAMKAATELLSKKDRPDAFFNVSDNQSLGVMQAAESLGLRVPEDVGIFGFANELFTKIMKPGLSTVDQKSNELGRRAASLYFDIILKGDVEPPHDKKEIVKSEIVVRRSSQKNSRSN